MRLGAGMLISVTVRWFVLSQLPNLGIIFLGSGKRMQYLNNSEGQ